MATRRVVLGPTGETVRENIARIRRAQRLTLREVSDRLEPTDRPLAHNTISEIERGARRVDVDDLIAVAAALDVSPNTLLMRAAETGDLSVEITAAQNVSAREFWFFLEGMRPLFATQTGRAAALDFAVRSQPSFIPLHHSVVRRATEDGQALMVYRKIQSDGLSVELEVGVDSESIFAHGSGAIPLTEKNS